MYIHDVITWHIHCVRPSSSSSPSRYFVDIEDDDVYARGYRRHQVAEIMKNLWAAPPHRKALEKVGASDSFRRYADIAGSSTSGFVNSRTLMGCANPPLSVFSRLSSNHLI